jgi:hypothetical protein
MVCREWRDRGGGGGVLMASTAVWRTARCYMFLCWLLLQQAAFSDVFCTSLLVLKVM